MSLVLEFMTFIESQSDLSSDALLDKILLKCRRLLDAEAGTIFLIETGDAEAAGSDARRIRSVSLQNDAVDMSTVKLDLAVDWTSVAGYVGTRGETVLIDDLYNPPANLPFDFNHRIDDCYGYRSVSMMSFALRTFSGEIVGVVQLINRRLPDRAAPVPFETAQLALIEPVNRLIGRAIERTVLIDQLRARNVSLETEIADRKEAQRELRLALASSEAASRAKSEFLAHMSHELRTPLTSVIGFAQIMEDDSIGRFDRRQFRQYSLHIRESGEHLLTLIDDVLDLSKIEAGETILDEQEIDVADTMRAVLRMVREPARTAGLALNLGEVDDLPALLGDGRALKQVLINMLSNAIKYTPAGGRVDLRATVDPDGCLVISVSDTGCGIAEKDLARVMEPFAQTAPAYVRRHTGVGLGLPLVKSLVELHGGRVRLKSERGGGTTVDVVLPAWRLVRDSEGQQPPAQQAS